jgi:hypothetical protein
MTNEDGQDAKIIRVVCESDAWPFAADVGLFEARRAIGQLARTTPWKHSPRHLSPPIVYLRLAKYVSDTIREVTKDLVAEARARGTSWADIGGVFDIGATGAQRRFGKGIDPSRLQAMASEKAVIRQSNEAIASSFRGYEDVIAEAMEDLDGTTPAERFSYALSLILGIDATFTDVEAELERDQPDSSRLTDHLFVLKNKIITLHQTLLVDPAQWDAVVTWSDQTRDPDAANYHAPAAYWYFVLRQIWLAMFPIIGALGPDMEFHERIELLMKARPIIRQIMMVLSREDIRFPQPDSSEEDGV